MANLKRIFLFTLGNQMKASGYKRAIIIGMAICLLLPTIIMGAIEVNSSKETEAVIPSISQVFLVDYANDGGFSFEMLNLMGQSGLENVDYVACDDNLDKARSLSDANSKSLVLVTEKSGDSYTLSLIKPENTALSSEEIDSYSDFLNDYFRYLLIEKSGLSQENLQELLTPIVSMSNYDAEMDDMSQLVGKKVISYFVPYLFIMVLYFLVLFYGYNVSTSVVSEKSSKLMDNFLIYVKPHHMILGKTLAIALAGIVQFSIWFLSLIGGFACGTTLVKAINPQSQMAIITIFQSLGDIGSLLSLEGIIIAIFISLSGFLLYCSIASIGGAMASKTEDLSSTNGIFSLVLLASFFAVIFVGLQESSALLNWIPFTAALIAPGRAVLGDISPLSAVGIAGLILLSSVIIMFIAGKIYKAFALYKGDPPKLSDALKRIKG